MTKIIKNASYKRGADGKYVSDEDTYTTGLMVVYEEALKFDGRDVNFAAFIYGALKHNAVRNMAQSNLIHIPEEHFLSRTKGKKFRIISACARKVISYNDTDSFGNAVWEDIPDVSETVPEKYQCEESLSALKSGIADVYGPEYIPLITYQAEGRQCLSANEHEPSWKEVTLEMADISAWRDALRKRVKDKTLIHQAVKTLAVSSELFPVWVQQQPQQYREILLKVRNDKKTRQPVSTRTARTMCRSLFGVISNGESYDVEKRLALIAYLRERGEESFARALENLIVIEA